MLKGWGCWQVKSWNHSETRRTPKNHLIQRSPLAVLDYKQSAWRASLVAPTVKNLPATLETWVQCLSQEDPLEKGMATHCRILAWRIPRTEEPGRLQSMGSQESDTTERLTLPFFHFQSAQYLECNWIIPKQHPRPQSVGKLSSMKSIPSAKKVGNHWKVTSLFYRLHIKSLKA